MRRQLWKLSAACVFVAGAFVSNGTPVYADCVQNYCLDEGEYCRESLQGSFQILECDGTSEICWFDCEMPGGNHWNGACCQGL